MTAEERKAIALELGKVSSFAARNLEAEAARHAIAAIGLAQDMLEAGQDAPSHLQSLREHVRRGGRRTL